MSEQRREKIIDNGLLRVNEACEFLKCSRTALYDMMNKGKLMYVKIGRGRRIPKNALVELAASALVGVG
jgi:excisionase family DNA binding protein